MLRIRQFVKDVDELVWVKVLNSAYQEYRDWRAISVEELMTEEENQDSQSHTRFVAELDGRPVGIIHAYLEEPLRRDNGIIEGFGVIPDVHGLGVEEQLVKSAVKELKRHGVTVIRMPRLRWPNLENGDRIEFLEKLGFNLVRRISLMEISLEHIPSNIGENSKVTLRLARKNRIEDVEMLSWLRNECSKDQFNYRPTTTKEIRDLLLKSPYSYLETFFALLDEQIAGFIVLGIDEKYNVEKNVKAGIVLGIGVLKPHRKKGVGTALVLHGLEALRPLGMTKAGLDVDDFNQTRAKELYQKVGFKTVERYLTYEMNIKKAKGEGETEEQR